MGKPLRKKQQVNNKQQAKISSFFQVGSSSASTATASQLFEQTGPKSTCSTGSQQQQALSLDSRSSSCKEGDASDDEDDILIPDTPQLPKTVLKVPNTSTGRSCTSEPLSDALPAGTGDGEIIPDTPVRNSVEKSKRAFPRSFLCSSSSMVPKAAPTKAEIRRLNQLRKSAKSLEERIKETAAKELESTEWKNANPRFAAATADLGLPLQAGKPLALYQQQVWDKQSRVCPGKRLRSIKRPPCKGELPNPKRHAKVSGLGAAQLSEARRKLALSVSEIASEFEVDKQSLDSDEEDLEVQNGCEIMVQSSNTTTFRWGKQKPEKCTKPTCSIKAEEMVPASEDTALSTILTEIQPQNPVSNSGRKSVLPLPSFKRLQASGICAKDSTAMKDIASDRDVDQGDVDSDSTLDDIMSQLRHTLADTPKYLKKTTSPVKRCSGISTKETSLRRFPVSRRELGIQPPPAQLEVSEQSSTFLSSNCANIMETAPVPPDRETNVTVQVEATAASGQGLDAKAEGDAAICNATDPEEKLSHDFGKFSPFKEIPNSAREKAPPKPGVATLPHVSLDAPVAAFGRFQVLSIVDHGTKKILEIVSAVDGSNKQAVLCGFWLDTHIKVGDTVHIIGDFTADGQCYITDTSNLLVVNPDLLISGTTVVSTVQCMRRCVLNEKFKGCDSRSIHMLHGSIAHSFFQKVLQEQAFSKAAMEKIAKDVIAQNHFLHEMFALDVTEAAALEEINKFLPTTLQFVEKYVPSTHGLGAQKQYPDVNVALTDIADIEENIWSPRYGIKGKIDLTVEVKIRKEPSSKWAKKVMPLELKTGKATHSIEHKGQVTLYSMMLADRRQDPEGGLLLYLRNGSLANIPATYIEKRGLIQLRNELAYYLASSTEISGNLNCGQGAVSFKPLPPPINNERLCQRCPHLLNCTAYQSTMEKHQLSASHQMSGLIPATLAHLTQVHLDYFKHWCTLLHLEMTAPGSVHGSAQLSHIWCKTAEERERQGECLSGLVLVPDQCMPVEGDKFLQAFSRRHNDSRGSVSDVWLGRAETVVVSAENRPLLALCTGSIQTVNNSTVVILTDRDLKLLPDLKSLVFRLDKNETFNTSSYYFTNLSRLMEDNEKSGRLRRVIIERQAPQFDLTMSKSVIERGRNIFKVLNKPQKTAILKVLMSRDYVLIKGYPGTGKTSTIVALVRILSVLGYSVLLASYTHSAVDNILLKLKQHEVDFVRVGRLERIHPDIRSHSAELMTKSFHSVADLQDFYMSKAVVATTCLGTNHILFSQRTFDICIIDEASQVLQLACLGPLLCSRKFVLVGDPLQLSPIVKSKQARDMGMSESLFARLDDTGATYELDVQYRMNKEIMRLSNELVYAGALKCGSDAIATSTLCLPHRDQVIPACPAWLQEVMSGQEVQFLDTGDIKDSPTEDLEGCVRNEVEAAVATAIARCVVQAGLPSSDIGLIAPYRQQVRLLRDRLANFDLDLIEVNTVDQYQGRDKALIIMSFVRASMQDRNVSEILKDVCRLNVALTRAKYCQIMLGHAAVLQGYRPLAQLLNTLRPSQLVKLPPTAHMDCLDLLEKLKT